MQGLCELFFFFFLTNLFGSHALQLGEKKTIETLLTGQMCSARSVLVIFNFEHPHSRERKSPFLQEKVTGTNNVFPAQQETNKPTN